MKTIAILCGRYLPGYKDGGPIRTIENLVECLGKEYHFLIITNDRERGDSKPYEGIVYNRPNKVGQAIVYYLKPGGFTGSAIEKLTKKADLIYICGPYNDYAIKTLLLKRIGKIKQPVVVAPMGSFSEGAYSIKKLKKSIFIKVCKVAGIFKKITWSVTTEAEKKDTCYIIDRDAKCIVAEDLPRKIGKFAFAPRNEKLKIIFISRICVMKNLLYAIEILKLVKGEVVFDIYGPIEDKKYWEKCKDELKNLPSNIEWHYRGPIRSENVPEMFSQYEAFLFPTMGENFGHVIYESLSSGCIPIISDKTPWGDIEKVGCGKVVPLADYSKFVSAVQELVNLDQEALEKTRKMAYQYASNKYKESVRNSGYKIIFG